MECGKGKSFISRSTMMENAIKAADDVSDWVYVHSQLLKFQAEHITMQDIPVFKTYQAEVDDSYEESFTRKKKEAYDVLKARCIVSRLQQSYFVALLLMNFLLSLKKIHQNYQMMIRKICHWKIWLKHWLR